MKGHKLLIVNALIIFLLTACVSKKKYLQMESSYVSTENALQNAKEINLEIAADTSYLGEQLRLTEQKVRNLEDYSKYSQSTMSKKLKEMEMSLAKQEFELAGRDKYLTAQADSLKGKEKLLNQKSMQLKSVKRLITKQNAVLDTLNSVVLDALNNFSEDELSIVTKAGKVYISMSENLLFPRGSVTVSKQGEEALKRLAKVLEEQNDIIVRIEGHTDDKPIKGGSIRNNWDLSVMRASSVANILVNNGVFAWRVIPSGRSEFSPLVENITEEDRKINRRTEIILEPNMRPLLKLLETQN